MTIRDRVHQHVCDIEARALTGDLEAVRTLATMVLLLGARSDDRDGEEPDPGDKADEEESNPADVFALKVVSIARPEWWQRAA